MAGLWSRKFDHKNGETRICNQCGEAYHTPKPINRCRTCVNARQKLIERVKRGKYKKKEQYPFDTKTNQASSRFCRIHRELNLAWIEYNKTGDKSHITKHYDKQLKEIIDNGIMAWILDRRCLQAQQERKSKSKGMIKKEYPDTRGYYEY